MANIHKGPLFAGVIFTLEMVPTELYKFFTMVNKIILKILQEQCRKLKEFYS
jgi:hypothetical protein